MEWCDWHRRVLIDKIPNFKDASIKHYIFSRPFNLSGIRLDDSIKLYTTAAIKYAMICDEEIKKRIIVIDGEGTPYIINFEDNLMFRFRAFRAETYTLSVVILIDYREQLSLYFGRFMYNAEFLKHATLSELIRNEKIHDLYIDGRPDLTVESKNEYYLAKKAINQLFIKENALPQYFLLIDDFGYEDFIVYLNEGGFHVYLDTTRVDLLRLKEIYHKFCDNGEVADVIFIDKIENLNENENKIIELNTVFKYEHTVHVEFSLWPSKSHTQFLVNLIQPKFVLSTDNNKFLRILNSEYFKKIDF